MSLEWILSQVQRRGWRMRGVGWFVAGTGFGQLAMAWLASTEFPAETGWRASRWPRWRQALRMPWWSRNESRPPAYATVRTPLRTADHYQIKRAVSSVGCIVAVPVTTS